MFYLYKLLFLSMLIMSTLISISSLSWLGMWMGLEINLLSFIPLMSMKNNLFSSESSMKYFLIQAMASSMFLFSIIIIMFSNKLTNELFMINNIMLIMMNSTILLKMGAAPFHFWFPEIMENLNWMNSLILMTWQKIAPMIIISYMIKNNLFILLIIINSAFIGSIGGLNQTSLRKILAYSSINHIGWLLSSFLINEIIWMIYFFIYSFINLSIIMTFNKINTNMLKQLYSTMNFNPLMKFFIFMNFLSLGGLPPFLGFLPKWMIIQNLSFNFFLLNFLLIMMTLITLFFYIRMTYSSIMMYNNELNFNMLKNNYNFSYMLINILSFISTMGLMMYSLIINFI
uniref:NADH-ubiquinone oxidoreductase chain 2 n=1 Tax=Porhydrus obliquesignatus TaxID=1309536 RepID=A0A894JYF3_9DYTI|nr:NADH dehydrogenase subunit 2 [Porhydrus obliquesignatus]QRV62842.1 NADH dehydrogenase subunit 2 [Porhydrus obliquesignatus]